MPTEKSSDESAPPREELSSPEESAPVLTEENETEPMETVAVSGEDAESAGASGQLLEACPSCGTLMDVTEQAPFAKIYCPSCGQSLRARKQFNNYKLVELIGEGGMGSVFKAIDCNLNRKVALKILKKECSANAEERAKLEQEARVTASINHPHVVKVFSFGEDHGQFYLAMELVEKGSLDALMGIQKRVAEAQILEVGIQIAEGLDAALERTLIHRDIKPGNILFSDPHTAKLVDFGLAIIMDEAAQARGEIWGTPYYIAPEKLDHQPEDYRSDIYSLGGTLFHALAGRPPYEAETASMVALKQLKSLPVSLQAFAPDVSSETAYVVNRMLAKNPEDRYASYRELIDHLSYARHKLMERTQKPPKPKERVVLETQANRNLTAFLSLGLLVAIIIAAGLIYIFRDKILGNAGIQVSHSQAAAYSSADIDTMFQKAVKLAGDKQFDDARAEFERIAALPEVTQPTKNWALMNEALVALLTGDGEKAASLYSNLVSDGLYSTEESDNALANFFVEASKQLANSDQPIPSSISRLYSNQTFESFGLLSFAMHDWNIGNLRDAGPLLGVFLKSNIPPAQAWIKSYLPLATAYQTDIERVSIIESSLPNVKDAASASKLLAQLRQARSSLQIGGKAAERLDTLEQQLAEKGGK